MVYKEHICAWFGRACGWERIDLMCKLLQQCSALELRFIGSCVEDRARKDFHGLRECELKANDGNEIRKLVPDITDERTRGLLNIYMSVLYSINTQCSHYMFELITRIQVELSSRTANSPAPHNQKFTEDVLLLYTMAAYHPGFTFHQRQKLWECLRIVEDLFGDTSKETPADFDEHDELQATSITIPVSNHGSTCLQKHVDNQEKQVHVNEIELKGSQWKSDERRSEFHIQVTWSDGEITDAWRTYQDIYNFHAGLIKLFPEDSGAHKLERHIPFLPQSSSRGEKTAAIDQEQIGKYIRELSSVPGRIIQCDHVANFFRGCTNSPGGAPGQHGGCTHDPKAARKASGHTPQSCTPPQVHTHHADHKHAYSSAAQSSSAHSSPLPSPLASPRVSPSQSVCSSSSSRPSSPKLSSGLTIAQWLKGLRLHKYTDSLQKYTWAEVFKLTDHDLENIGLTTGARKKLRSEIEQLKKKTIVMNGVSCADTGSPLSSPGTWHTPPSSATYLSSSQGGGAACSKSPSFGSNASSSAESSPTCSEYSSPPLSPLSHNTHRAQPARQASLDELDREESEEKREPLMNPPRQQTHPAQDQGATVNNPSRPPPTPQSDTGTHSNTTFVPIQNSAESSKVGQAPPVNMHNYPPLGYPRPPGVHTQTASEISATGMYRPPGPSIPVRSPRPHAAAKVVHHMSTTAQIAVTMPVNGYGSGGDVHVPESMLTTSSNAVLSAPGPGLAVHMGTSLPVGGANIARPSTLGVPMPMMVPGSIASTNVTYTMAPGTSIPPPSPLDVKNVMIPSGMNMSSAAEVSGGYAVYHQGGSTTSSTVTYTSPGFQPAQPNNGPPGQPPHFSIPGSVVTPQAGGPPQGLVGVRQSPSPAGCGTQNSASPAPVHVPNHGVPTPTPTTVPTPNPTPNGGSIGNGCSSCGCSGHCGQAAPTPTYQYNFPHVWPPNPLMSHHSFPVGFAVTSNGMIGHNIPSLPFSPHHVQQQPPPFNLPNGVTPEVLYNNSQTNFAMMHSAAGTQHPPFMAPHLPFMPGLAPAAAHIGLGAPGLGKIRNTTPMCHNCGQTGHRAPDCKEATMESITRSAQYQLNLTPKSEAE